MTAAFPRPDGRVLFVGAVPDRGEQVKFFQVSLDGRLDTTFGINGTAAFNPVNGMGQTAAVLTPDGRVVTNHGRVLAAFDLDAATPPEARGVALSVYPPVPGDVTGDGRPDTVTAGQAGEEPRVRVVDGATGQVVAGELADEPTFTGGVFAATADLDGDGRDEVIVSPDVGGGARVQVFSGDGGRLVQRANFFAIEDPNFRGGARIAAADVNSDGVPDLLVGAGVGGGPRVAVFDGRGLVSNGAAPPKLIDDFFAFPGPDATTLRDGVYLSAGDLTGDGKAEVVFGGGPGGAPRVFVLDGRLVAANRTADAQAGPVANFFVDGNSTLRGGVRVAAADLDADGTPELAAHVPEFPRSPRVRAYTAAAVVGASGQVLASNPTREQLDAAAALFGVQVE